MYSIIQTNTAYEQCNWLASKTYLFKLRVFTLAKILSLHLLNLGVLPVSQEGEERKIY